MFQLGVDYEFDELLELRLSLLEDQLEISFLETLAGNKAVFFQKSEHILSRDVAFACSIDSLEKHNRAELPHESVLQVKP